MKKTCCICGQKFTNYGNNAWPVSEGRCCDDCNTSVVIPERMRQIRKNTSDTLSANISKLEQETSDEENKK